MGGCHRGGQPHPVLKVGDLLSGETEAGRYRCRAQKKQRVSCEVEKGETLNRAEPSDCPLYPSTGHAKIVPRQHRMTGKKRSTDTGSGGPQGEPGPHPAAQQGSPPTEKCTPALHLEPPSTLVPSGRLLNRSTAPHPAWCFGETH